MHKTTFTVYPDDCNFMKAIGSDQMMVHGGTLLLKMDRTASECVRQALYKTECDSALTVGVDKVTFHFGAKLGDMIHIESEIVELGFKRIGVKVECFVEEWGGNQKKMAEGMFNFCSFKNGVSHSHNLTFWNREK